MVTSFSDISKAREENKQKILSVRARAASEITTRINNLTKEIGSLTQSQDELVNMSINGFMRIFWKLNDVSPQKLEEFRQIKLKERGVTADIEEANKLERLMKANTQNHQYLDKYTDLVEKIAQEEKKLTKNCKRSVRNILSKLKLLG